ncbi:hypothetical protein HNQ71_002027 [Mesorhizobium sangaii]|uniref:Uncharacterized protein n=1 Tax=Mesorhizobium sangaii TaxID=505389 RepID=A0A841PGP5_9HYPH|nr:hypothetical protein [Mesorhizobium sangaii]
MHRFSDQNEGPIIGRFSRRAILGAFASVPAIGAATAAAGVSRLPAAQPPEHTEERVMRLARELSAALEGMHGGEWQVTVDHSFGFALIVQHGAVQS